MASPSPLPDVRVEKWGSKILGNTSSAMPVPSSVTRDLHRGRAVLQSIVAHLAFTSARSCESCILEQVEQHFRSSSPRAIADELVLHVAAPRRRLRRTAPVSPRRARSRRRPSARPARSSGTAIPAEHSRDLVQPVDLGEDARHVLIEHSLVVGPPARAAEVLHAEPDRSEQILDLVRHLPRHLAPRQDALRVRQLGDRRA